MTLNSAHQSDIFNQLQGSQPGEVCGPWFGLWSPTVARAACRPKWTPQERSNPDFDTSPSDFHPPPAAANLRAAGCRDLVGHDTAKALAEGLTQLWRQCWERHARQLRILRPSASANRPPLPPPLFHWDFVGKITWRNRCIFSDALFLQAIFFGGYLSSFALFCWVETPAKYTSPKSAPFCPPARFGNFLLVPSLAE